MMLVKEKVARIPWKEYLAKQMIKIIGVLFITLLLIIVMVVSADIDLSTVTYESTEYIVAIIVSTLCFFLVLFGFTKIVLFDMANEFGLRDEDGKMVYNVRFWLFTMLALSFCSSIYLLLDVFLQETYLQLLPVIFMRTILDYYELDIEGLSELEGRKFYETARNLYFGTFFVLIIAFSILVFLVILTTFARRRIVKKFKKDEEIEEKEEAEGIRTVYKLFIWIIIPFFLFFVIQVQGTSIGPLVNIIYLLAAIWWVYQVLKTVFLIVWRGVKITAFITSINLLVIIPLIATLWLLPTLLWGGWDTLQYFTGETFDFAEAVNVFVESFVTRIVDFEPLIQLDFIIITIAATLVVGFAEGFAFIAIFTALSKGIEVARSGEMLARSPPKVMVFSKYLLMLGVWVSLLWDSFGDIIEMLKNELSFDIDLTVPNFLYLLHTEIVIPISDYLAKIWPTLEYLPFLILPIIFIFSGAFKFLSVTLVTPKVKDRGDIFFLLVSTSFVLIITNILGDIYELAIPDAPLRSLSGLTTILSSAVGTFENVESIAFYGGFFFGIMYVISKAFTGIGTPTVTSTPTDDLDLPALDSTPKEPKPSTPAPESVPEEPEPSTPAPESVPEEPEPSAPAPESVPEESKPSSAERIIDLKEDTEEESQEEQEDQN